MEDNPPDEPPPILLVDRFQLLELVGRGTTGVVHRAIDTLNNNEIVAIKLVDLEECEDDVLDIQREINVLANCDSPHVTKYLGSWLVPKTTTLAIAMEYMGGGSVQDLCRESPLDEKIVRVVLRDVVKALKYLHEEGKIHRDVKCANILLNENGEVRLADFGVSGQMTQTIGARRKTFAGTPFWMAPEIIQSSGGGGGQSPSSSGFGGPNGYDEKADIWSLGITAIEAATGSVPHAHLHPMRALFVIPQSAPPELPYNNKDEEGGMQYNFSEEFRDFVRQCLKMSPEERPRAEDLLKHPFLAVRGVGAEAASNNINSSSSSSSIRDKTSNDEINNASAEEREEVSTVIAEAKIGVEYSTEKLRQQAGSLALEFTAPPDAAKEEKKSKTRRKKPPPPLHSPPRTDTVNRKIYRKKEVGGEGGENRERDDAKIRTTISENGSEETATTPSTQKEADDDFPNSSRSSTHSTMSGSHKSKPDSIGNSSWDFGSGALGRRYSKKLQDQQQQKSPSASNSSFDALSPKSRSTTLSLKLDGNEPLPRTSLLLKTHVRDSLRDLKIPTHEANAVFSALVGMEIAVTGSIDALFNGVHEKIAGKDGKDESASSRDKELSSERSVLAEYLLSRWRDDLIREEIGYDYE